MSTRYRVTVREVTRTMLYLTIDWLAVNFKELTHEAENFMSTYARVGTTQDTTPRFGYSYACVDHNGSVIQWNPDREDMGHHIIFAGSALRNLFQHSDVQPSALLSACLDAGGNISRLDLAADLRGREIDLQSLYQSLEQGLNIGHARTYGQIRSNDNGHTIYIGSRQSERFIRIYNKAAQMGESVDKWYRFELETKGMVSRALAIMLVATAAWLPIFVGVCSDMVSIPGSPELGAFYNATSAAVGTPKIEKSTDTEKWIATQVIPAVSKYMVENPDSEAVHRLIQTLNYLRSTRK